MSKSENDIEYLAIRPVSLLYSNNTEVDKSIFYIKV